MKIYAEPAAVFSGQSIIYNGTSYDVFSTGTAGVGMIVEVAVSGDYIPLVKNKNLLLRDTTITTVYNFGMRVRVQLVALTKLPPGQLSFVGVPSVVTQWVGPVTARQAPISASIASASIQVKNASCKLDMPTSVKLPRVDVSLMRSVSDTAGDTPFTLSVNCDGGYVDYKVSYTMTDVNSTANVTSNLVLENLSGSAKGISLQVLDSGTPVLFGPPGSLTSRREFGTVVTAGSLVGKTMVVRYIRTSAGITPGVARAGSTMTLSYQ
ncbi:fimbrial protein [Pseudomonas sp. Au-Pse12]|uniref:fimbrial protein n=1 Tax=Pseudomonas sp. Au-Pse12 TaxID=2906459 RepID=UPI001E5F4D0A|nr:fimbrial protein [Pseudomonas sp. Au-Pse12]MCE4052270.1 fimbrial protein [Pseudomonas sp. Au-Pse12]